MMSHINGSKNKSGLATLISDKTDFKTKIVVIAKVGIT